MKKIGKIYLLLLIVLFFIQLTGCKKVPTTTILIKDNITLTSDENIKWEDYITIKVDDETKDLKDATITLLSGDSNISGVCTYEVYYVYKKIAYRQTFDVTFEYPKKVPTFEIKDNIVLTSNQNIDWSHYITIKVNGVLVDLANAAIKIQSGNSGASGICSYRVTYVCDGIEYFEDFSVTYQYPTLEKITPTFEIANNITLTSTQNIDWSQYITIKVNNVSVSLENANITLISGDATISGTCSYKITYTYDNEVYEKTFTVTYQYPMVEQEIGNIQNQVANTSCEVTGVIVAITSNGILLKDLNEEEYVYVFKGTAVTNKLYDVVKVNGTITSFGNKNQITNPTITDLNQNSPVTFEPVEYTAALVDAYAAAPTVGVPVTVTGTLTIKDGYYNVAVAGATTTVSICNPTQDLSSLDGSKVTFSGYFIYLSSGYAYIAVVGDIKSTGGSTEIQQNTLTDEQITIWNTAINKDYTDILITDSIHSLQQKQYQGLYHLQTFDKDARVEMNYYKYINHTLNTYTYTGWKPISSNPLMQFNFELLKTIDSTHIIFQEFDTGLANVTGFFVIDTTTLTVQNFIPSWTSLNAKQFAFAINTDNTLAKIYAICEDGDKTVYHFVQVSLLNETSTIVDPETSCNEVSILEIQDMASEQLCTTTGIVVEHTKTGYLIGDPNNEFSYVYLNTGTLPTIAINNEVKVFGIVSMVGSSLQFNDASTFTITDLGSNSENPKVVKYNPEYIEAAEFIDYGEEPFSGYEVQFIATITSTTKLQVENSNFDVTIIDPITDYTPYLHQKIMVKGYILYSISSGTEENPIYSFYVIVKEISEDTTNPTLRALTADELTVFNSAITKDYSNVTIHENITDSISYITTDGISVLNAVDENGNTFNYQLRHTESTYEYSEDGSTWQTLTEAEYYSYALIIFFNKIDTSKVVYNTKYNLYQISPNDLSINAFIPYLGYGTFINFQFKLNEDGYIATIALTEVYENYIYIDCLYLSDYGTTTLVN